MLLQLHWLYSPECIYTAELQRPEIIGPLTVSHFVRIIFRDYARICLVFVEIFYKNIKAYLEICGNLRILCSRKAFYKIGFLI